MAKYRKEFSNGRKNAAVVVYVGDTYYEPVHLNFPDGWSKTWWEPDEALDLAQALMRAASIVEAERHRDIFVPEDLSTIDKCIKAINSTKMWSIKFQHNGVMLDSTPEAMQFFRCDNELDEPLLDACQRAAKWALTRDPRNA